MNSDWTQFVNQILDLGLQVRIRQAGGDHPKFVVEARSEGQSTKIYHYHDDWQVALGECWRQVTLENPSLEATVREHWRAYQCALDAFRKAMVKLEAEHGEYAVSKAREAVAR